METSSWSNYNNSRRQCSACKGAHLMTPHVHIFSRRTLQKSSLENIATMSIFLFVLCQNRNNFSLQRIFENKALCRQQMRILFHSGIAVVKLYFVICPPTPCIIPNDSLWRKLISYFVSWSCWSRTYPAFANSVDPDQLASLEKPTNLDLHCLPFRMWINTLDRVIWLAEN